MGVFIEISRSLALLGITFFFTNRALHSWRKMLLNILKCMKNMLAKFLVILHKRKFLTCWEILLLYWVDVVLESAFRTTSLICCFTF